MNSDWISVKDRLPKGEPIWVHRPNIGKPVQVWQDYLPTTVPILEVTHWMPATLPEPPKSEAETALNAAWYAHVGLNLYSPSEQANFKAGFLAGWQAHEKRGEG